MENEYKRKFFIGYSNCDRKVNLSVLNSLYLIQDMMTEYFGFLKSDNIILKKDKIIIIHGIGTGLVRQAVHEVLSQNKYVSEYHTLNLNNGCTIAYLIIDNK